jgi:hypothetical protein
VRFGQSESQFRTEREREAANVCEQEVEEKVKQLLPDTTSSPNIFGTSNTARNQIYYVTPRNISPWSSKATSIAHVCGLKTQVQRIERGRAISIEFVEPFEGGDDIPFRDALYDRMTENIGTVEPSPGKMFIEGQPYPLEVIDLSAEGSTPLEILKVYNTKRGLALDQPEMEYLVQAYKQLGRNPYDIELFMFAQVNSEHCRHKQFNANWTIDGIGMGKSLFEMIRNTHSQNPQFTVSAYSDNAAVLEGEMASFWAPDYSTGSWRQTKEKVHFLAKVETLLADVDVGSDGHEFRGYHKPVMIAGGVGTVRPEHALKNGRDVKEGAHVIVLGGPAMLIGLGGGAASSNASGENSVELDFDSVQRGNPEMQRRAQMVINACMALGENNPIAFIHDVGAGGLSNALPELVKDAGYGGNFELRQVENADPSMSPLQVSLFLY